MRRAALAALVAVGLAGLVWFGGVGPVALLPGGHLWGRVAEPPPDWSFTDAVAEVQLQVRRWGFFPWSVTTWVMTDGPTLYIGASHCNRTWTGVAKRHPEVRVRIQGRVYEMTAHPEARPEVAAVLAPRALHKYLGIEVESATWDGTSPGCIFRMEPRP